MKRIILLALLTLSAIISVMAQSEMNVGPLFDGRYRSNPNAVETILSGTSQLQKYHLECYRSLSVSDDADFASEAVPMITADGANATDREVSYRKGALYYAFYTFKGRTGQNTYLLYLNQWLKGGKKIVVIYMRGKATPDEIKKLFKH